MLVTDLENDPSASAPDRMRKSRNWGGGPVLSGLFGIFGGTALASVITMPAWAAQAGCWFLAAVLNFLYAQWLGADADRFRFGFLFVRFTVRQWTLAFLVLALIAAIANWRA